MERYAVHDWRNGLAVLKHANEAEWDNLVAVLRGFRLLHTKIATPSGRKSLIADRLDGSWRKVHKAGGSDGRGVGSYLRNVTKMFGVPGKNARTLPMGRSQVNMLQTRKRRREHSRKRAEQYDVIKVFSPSPRTELFGRGPRLGPDVWENQTDGQYEPTGQTYAQNPSRV